MTNLLIVTALLLLVSAGCGHDHPTSAPSPGHWIPTDTLATVAVLQIDYLTHRFEGGVVRQFAQREPAANDSLPFTLRYQAPGDLGWTLLLYTETGDTVFF
jgi:hypothetical protein